MRELKFRAWNGKMMLYPEKYSGRLKNCAVWGIDCFGKFVNAKSLNGECILSPQDKSYEEQFKIILMQYTGLTDKNGVEIYEGDIVNVDGYGRNHICMYSECWCGPYLQDSSFDKEGGWSLNGSSRKQMKVIGNIYQHKELLDERI